MRLLERWRKIAYSSGSLGSALLSQAFGAFVLFFYEDTVKLPVAAVGTLFALYGFWNAINDPLFGYLSDRTRTRWGRRIPYIALGFLPLAVAFALVWSPPLGAGTNRLLAYFFAVIFVYDGLYTLVILNWTALFPEMFRTLEERAQVSAWRQIFTVVGALLGMAAAPLLYGSRLGWAGMGWLFALVAALSLGVSLLGSREGATGRAGSEEAVLSPWLALRYTFSSRSFLFYVLTSFSLQLNFTLLPSVVPFFTKYVLRVGSTETSMLLGVIFVVAFLAMIPWSRVTVRIGARAAIIRSAILFALVLWGFLLVQTFAQALVVAALAGVGLAGQMMLLDVLIADVIDEDELRTGVRREGMYFGMQALIIRLGIAVQALVMTLTQLLTGYDPHLAVQPPRALLGLRLLLGGVPSLFIALGVLSMLFYPLWGPRLAELRTQLAARQAAAGPAAGAGPGGPALGGDA
ncbi:MAG: MFS transporter [Bacillota bacterium]|nr:MFS transporter [Bacillota bacterium]